MPTPAAERPPKGVANDPYWLGVWRHAIKVLKDQGTWAWEQHPLLVEYVEALRAAQRVREGYEWLDALEVYAGEHASDLEPPDFQALAKIVSSLPNIWDKHVRRAQALADQLALTDRGRAALGRGKQKDAEDVDPFGALDAGRDEVAERRAARHGA